MADPAAPAPPPAAPSRPTITLVLGGARSGKSSVAERLLERRPGPLLYLATGSAAAVDGTIDADMATRIDAHVARRGDRYTTIEAGAAVNAALASAPPLPVLLDSLGTWVAAHHDPAVEGFPCDPDALCSALVAHPAPVVVVGEEVGMGVHPETAVGRTFRDVLGNVNRAVADVADDVLLVAAGRVVRLDRLDVVLPPTADGRGPRP